MASVATDGKDENGLKLEKIGPNFSSFDAMSSKFTNDNYYGWLSLIIKIRLISSLLLSSIVSQEHFVYV